MSLDAVRAGWERRAFYIAKESVLGTPADEDIDWTRYKEASMADPDSARPRENLGPLGTGNVFPIGANVALGRKGPTFSAEFPCTPTILNDLASLWSQNAHNADADGFEAPEDPTADVQATIITRTADVADGALNTVRATGAVLSSIGMNIAQNDPQSNSGLVTLTTNWMAQTSAWGTYYVAAENSGIGTLTTESDDRLFTRDCTFRMYYGAQWNTHYMVSANFTLNNGIVPMPVNADLIPAYMVGNPTITGSITVLDEEGAASTPHKLFRTEIDASSVSVIPIKFAWALESGVQEIELHVTPMGLPSKTVVGPALAWTWNFETLFDGTLNPVDIKVTKTAYTYANAMFYS